MAFNRFKNRRIKFLLLLRKYCHHLKICSVQYALSAMCVDASAVCVLCTQLRYEAQHGVIPAYAQRI